MRGVHLANVRGGFEAGNGGFKRIFSRKEREYQYVPEGKVGVEMAPVCTVVVPMGNKNEYCVFEKALLLLPRLVCSLSRVERSLSLEDKKQLVFKGGRQNGRKERAIAGKKTRRRKRRRLLL